MNPCSKIALTSLLLSLLCACSSTSQPDASPSAGTGSGSAPPTSQRCDSDAAQTFIGQRVDEALVERAQQSTGARVARVLRPGDAITMEYDPYRLNLDTDANGVVRRASCG